MLAGTLAPGSAATPDQAKATAGRRTRGRMLGPALLAAALLEPACAQSTFRIEVHPVVTQDADALPMLAGRFEGPERSIAGELRLPFTDQVRVPAVVFLHGDAGAVSNQPLWIETFNALGVAVFTVDSFSARGHLGRTPGLFVEGALPGSLARTIDAYRALAVLARHPRIDARRIALMGVSSGGRVALNAALQRFARPLAGENGFAAFVALYPPCNVRLNGDTDLVAPLQIHHGAADTVTRPEYCRAYVERARAAGRDVQFFEYPAARHGYDGSPRMAPQRMAQAPNTSRCEIEEREGGRLVNAATGAPLRPGDACFGTGIEGGPDAPAGAATRESVAAFLRQRFELR